MCVVHLGVPAQALSVAALDRADPCGWTRVPAALRSPPALLPLRSWNGGSVRAFSTAAAAASVSPSFDAVLVKVGDSGKYMPFETPDLLRKNTTAFLQALADTRVFAARLKDIDLSACTVSVLKGSLPAGQKLPSPANEAPDKVLTLEGADTLSDAAVAGECAGKALFIRVQLPGPAGVLPFAATGAVATGGIAHNPLLRRPSTHIPSSCRTAVHSRVARPPRHAPHQPSRGGDPRGPGDGGLHRCGRQTRGHAPPPSGGHELARRHQPRPLRAPVLRSAAGEGAWLVQGGQAWRAPLHAASHRDWAAGHRKIRVDVSWVLGRSVRWRVEVLHSLLEAGPPAGSSLACSTVMMALACAPVHRLLACRV